MGKRLVYVLSAFVLVLSAVCGVGSVSAGSYPVVAASTDQSGTLADRGAFQSQLTADATQVAFLSYSWNLDPALPQPAQPDQSVPYVYLKNLQTGAVHLISVGTQNQADTQGWGTLRYQITPDGNNLVFITNHNLDTGQIGSGFVYERNLQTGVTTLVGVDPGGQTIEGQFLSVSDNGRYVAFGDFPTVRPYHVYVRDTQTNTTIQVPVNGLIPTLSGDGRYLFYSSSDDNGTVYRYGLEDGSNILVNAGDDGTVKPVFNSRVSSSADGNRVVFNARGPLITSDTNPCNQDFNSSRVYIRDFSAGTLRLLDVNDDGSDPAPGSNGCGASSSPTITPDGTKVVFSSTEGLAGSTTGHPLEAFVRDLDRNTVTGVSLNSSGIYVANGIGDDPSIAANGTAVSYGAFSGDLIPHNNTLQIYVTPVRVLPTVGTPQWSANPIDPGQTTTLTVPAAEISGVPVVGGEYFVDTDPGAGIATPMDFDGAILSTTFGNGLASGLHTVGVRAIDSSGTWSETTFDTLTVYPPALAPDFTSGSSATAGLRAPFDFKITTSGFHPPTITMAGSLPSGISFVDNGDGTAHLTGIAAANTAGDYPVTLTATNASGSANQTFTLSVTATSSGPAFASASSDTEAFGQPFSFIINTTGYPAPSITKKGTLPNGVTFTDNGDGTATLAGTPSGGAQGSYALTFTAKQGTAKVTQAFTLTITRAPIIKAVTGTSTMINQPLTVTIGTKGYTTPSLSFDTSAGYPPEGMTFTDNGDGTATITGTPVVNGAFPLTIIATNPSGTATRNITLKVYGPPTTMDTNAGFPPGIRSTFKVYTDGYPAPTFTITGSLPASITFNPSTGTFSGKPTVSELGHYHVTLTATNIYGSFTQDFLFSVAYPA